MASSFDSRITRRALLGSAAALLGAHALHAAPAPPKPATFRRFEITDPAMPPRVLQSYAKGISEMLKRPPNDPLNWYRNAFVHVLDCPHGNWWFLVWHRAYLGWFERKIRELSGDAEFALPYWDWTKTPRIPAAMFEGVLDPNNAAFMGSFDAFKRQFTPAVSGFYATLSAPQRALLSQGPVPTAADFWETIKPMDVDGMFFEQPDARGMTAAGPDFDETTQGTVAINQINVALRATTFAGTPGGKDSPGFGSAMALSHGKESRMGVLESQPHNNVHRALGGEEFKGFMTNMLSSVDPIFFLHHANLDRLWDAWTRRQATRRRPTLPTGASLAAFSREPFLFFTDEKGKPVGKTKAGDYTSMAVFDYDYAPGSGEDQVPINAPLIALGPPPPVGLTISTRAVGIEDPAVGTGTVPSTMLRTRTSESLSPVAEIRLNLTQADRGRRFRVTMATAGNEHVEAGAIAVFGHHVHGTSSFAVPVPENLKVSTNPTSPLSIRVLPLDDGDPPGAPAPGGHHMRKAKRSPPRAGAAAPAPAPQLDAVTVKMN